MLCLKCGAENPDDATECDSCGSPLDQQPIIPQPGPLDQKPAHPLSEPVPCRACGTPLAPGEKYCSKCRFPVADTAPPKKKKFDILFWRPVLKGIFLVLIIGVAVVAAFIFGIAGTILSTAASLAAAVPAAAQPESAAGMYTTSDFARVSTPAPAPTMDSTITDGYWCRNTRINAGKAPQDVIECYRFFPDGTYKWGYSPGWPMGRSPSCTGSPEIKCTYSLDPKGRIEVAGGLYFTVSGDALINPRDPPYFIRTSAGIP